MVTRSKINMNDYSVNVGNLLIDNTVGFNLDTSAHRILPYRNRFWNSITFELSRTQIEYTRVVYSTLDFLGDLGGLFGALGPFFSICVLILQYRGAYMFLLSDNNYPGDDMPPS